ncbi:unnamed protein product [Calypogeia fissa]
MEWYRVMWIVGHGTTPPIPDTLSERAKDFVKCCLDINPSQRPTAMELLNHPFVRQDAASSFDEFYSSLSSSRQKCPYCGDTDCVCPDFD